LASILGIPSVLQVASKARRAKTRRDARLDTIDEDSEEKSGHK